jgi:biotin transport system substrate-specific component
MSQVATLRNAVFPRSTILSKALFITGGAAFIALLAQIALPIPGQ